MKIPDFSKTANFYNDRYIKFGDSVKTVGWGNKESQQLRFDILFRGLNFKNPTILDIGCGLGDLVPYLQDRIGNEFKYIGIDVADNLIERAKLIHTGSQFEFYCCDIFSFSLQRIDFSILSGALSMRIDGMEEYANRVMQYMYEISGNAACLNFLSKYVDYELDKNLHYYPEEIFKTAKNFCKKINLYHDYPLYEFTIQLIK